MTKDERKLLSAKDPSLVVINIDGKDVAFDGTVWNAPGPRILIFDEHFIDTNIYSGLAVTAGHRQSIHELVIGEEGVKLNRKVQDLTAALADLQTKLKEAERALPSSVLGGLTRDKRFAGSDVSSDSAFSFPAPFVPALGTSRQEKYCDLANPQHRPGNVNA